MRTFLPSLVAVLVMVGCSDAGSDSSTQTGGSAGDGNGSVAGGGQSAGSGGSSESAGAPAVMCELPVNFGSTDCEECMSQSCCTIIEACDADCVAALTCADTCVLEGENEAEVDECITSCWGGAEPPAALDAIFVCQEQSCVAACFS